MVKENKKKSKSSFSVTNKSVQFFYFWARTRLVQHAIMVLSILWIILISYKSLLVVELMRHDVNVSQEAVNALLPKRVDLPNLIKENFPKYLFEPTSDALPNSARTLLTPDSNPNGQGTNAENFLSTTTIDYLTRNLQGFLNIKSNSYLKSNSTASRLTSNYLETGGALSEQTWLNYYHWLTLFDNYNVSLYNRYVAILPQIHIHRIVKQTDILKLRNKNEIKLYDSTLLAHQNEIYVHSSNRRAASNSTRTASLLEGEQEEEKEETLFKRAIFELVGIVILGIPTIVMAVYLCILFYKCLCSKRYEEWRQAWSTSNIKRQYKKMHDSSEDEDGDADSRAKKKSCKYCQIERSLCDCEEQLGGAEIRSDSDYEWIRQRSSSNRFLSFFY